MESMHEIEPAMSETPGAKVFQEHCYSSWVWQGIEKGLTVVQNNVFMEVNNGRRTRIWQDKWVTCILQPPIPVSDNHADYTFISELSIPYSNNRDVNLVNQLFDAATTTRILKMFLDTTKYDNLIWMPSKDGTFSVKNTYNLLANTTSDAQVNGNIVPTSVWKSLRKCSASHRVKLFVWKCIRDIIPTRSKTAVHNPTSEVQCGSCGQAVETIEHILLECRHAIERFGGA